jgi:Chitobiase/beta-hexosaminidase C-terminal domain
MRTHLVFFSLLLIPFSAKAQTDPGTLAAQAAQQATQQAQKDLQQAMQNASEANRQAAQATQVTSQNPPVTPCCLTWTAPPKFSVKAGKYPGPTKVTITDASRGAVIYYSTDGWTHQRRIRRATAGRYRSIRRLLCKQSPLHPIPCAA